MWLCVAGVPVGAGVRARARALVRSGAQQLATQQEQEKVGGVPVRIRLCLS